MGEGVSSQDAVLRRCPLTHHSLSHHRHALSRKGERAKFRRGVLAAELSRGLWLRRLSHPVAVVDPVPFVVPHHRLDLLEAHALSRSANVPDRISSSTVCIALAACMMVSSPKQIALNPIASSSLIDSSGVLPPTSGLAN